MKPYRLPKAIHPLYILATGIFGLALALWIFLVGFPLPNYDTGGQFASTRSFLTWVFLIAVLFAILSIIFLPGWSIFFRLFSHLRTDGMVKTGRMVGTLILSTLLYCLVGVALFFVPSTTPSIQYPPMPP